MAISDRRLAANRANAQKSTGPRTAEGKRAVALNAFVHGLTARSALLPGDDPEEYRAFAARICRDLRPRGALQLELAGEIVNATWKLRRVPAVEAAMLEQQHAEEYDPPMHVIIKMLTQRSFSDGSPNSLLWTVDRYAARLESERASAVRTLLSLQRRRKQREEMDAAFGIAGGDGDSKTHSVRRNKATAGVEEVAPQAPAAAADPPVGGSPEASPATGAEPNKPPEDSSEIAGEGADRSGEPLSPPAAPPRRPS